MAERQRLLPRNSLLWLLGAQTLAMAPLLLELPIWLTLVWSGVLLWRLLEFLGHWQMPGGLTRMTLVAVCVSGLVLSFGRFLGMEPMVALLICAVLLKQLEVRQLRDAIVLVYLTYFLTALQFLFSQTLLAGVFGLLCFCVNTAALLAIHQPQGHQFPLRTLRLAAVLLLHSVPLMLLMFLVMPRLGSLWAVPNPGHTATTGVSDSMAPGDFVRLSRAGGVAFRATFQTGLPGREELYWRGLVFSRFDGRRWQQAEAFDYLRDGSPVNWQSERPAPWRQLAQPRGRPVSYRVVMEPSQQPWLYSLGLATDVRTSASLPLGFTRDFRLLSAEPVYQRLAYQVNSALDYALEPGFLPNWRRRNELALPAGFNPQSLAQARQWRQQWPDADEYIAGVLQYFRAQFVYSLQPPALGRDSVDDFLWRTREGFCEHFASSFVVLMRAAGIPARVVAGYMGGEFNELENYVVVHQYDAHAWAEVWLEARGWVRVDPTAAVAPERVRQSLGDSRAADIESLVSLGRYRHIQWVAQLRLHWDAIQYRWDRAVLGFDRNSQSQLLERWLRGTSPLKIVLVVLIGGGLALALLSLHLWWQSRPPRRSTAQRFYQRAEKLLARYGQRRAAGESAAEFARRVAAAQPGLAPAVERVTACVEAMLYEERPVSAPQLKQALAELKGALRGSGLVKKTSL